MRGVWITVLLLILQGYAGNPDPYFSLGQGDMQVVEVE
jgi:hypothetical protein